MAAPSGVVRESDVLQWMAKYLQRDESELLQHLSFAEPVHCLHPQEGMEHFRYHPDACLSALKSTFDALATTFPDSCQVVAFFDNHVHKGLDAHEVEAVVGNWMHVRYLRQFPIDESSSRTIVIGRLRTDYFAISIRFTSLLGIHYCRARYNLSHLSNNLRQTALLLIGREQAELLARAPANPVTQLIRELVGAKWIALGLWVPTHRTTVALADLRAEAHPLTCLAQDELIPIVRFEDSARLNPPSRLREAMSAAGLLYDCSMVARTADSIDSQVNIEGPYLPAGAYQPLSFDLRMPSPTYDRSQIIEAISVPFERFGSWKQLVSWRMGWDPDRLAELLRFSRIESYFQRFDQSVYLKQHYHDYRIYNWPPPDGATRGALVDCGCINEQDDLIRALAEAEELAGFGTLRYRLTDVHTLLDVFNREITQAKTESTGARLDFQVESHGYLASIPDEQPLRQDVEDLISFLPQRLGTAVELGSGYGQLARALCPRADRYYCVELDNRMLQGLPAGSNLVPVVADLHSMPFDNDTFDSVVANNVLEHVYDPLTAFREIHRILKPGGALYALIPLDALNASHRIRTHLWKADKLSIDHCLRMSDLVDVRFELINLCDLGIPGSFPTCYGHTAKLEARRAA